MERQRTLPPFKFSKGQRQFLLAWPILAYEMTVELASAVTGIQKHTDWVWCYHLDRQFCADLLASITRFVHLPKEKWNLNRALSEFANTLSGTFFDEPHELLSWKDVVEYIELNCPHLKSAWLSGERLRKKEFYTEKKRRFAILKHWSANIDARNKYGLKDWYDRMPCLPCSE